MITDFIKLAVDAAKTWAGPIEETVEAKRVGLTRNDVAILKFFYPCFDRLAFRIPFEEEVQSDLIRALEDTAYALALGIRRTSEGIEIARGKSKSDFDSPQLRARFDVVVLILWDLRHQFDLAVATRAIHMSFPPGDTVGVFAAAVPEVVRLFDDSRNEILRLVNEPFVQIGKQPFPFITSRELWVNEGTSHSMLHSDIREFYTTHLGRQPPLFPARFDEAHFLELRKSASNKHVDIAAILEGTLSKCSTAQDAVQKLSSFVAGSNRLWEIMNLGTTIIAAKLMTECDGISQAGAEGQARALIETDPVLREIAEMMRR